MNSRRTFRGIRRRGIRLRIGLAACILVLAAPARAATRIDLDPDGSVVPIVPPLVDDALSPVYVTNSALDTAGSAGVDSLRVGAASSLHLGYDRNSAAAGDVALEVRGDMTVLGTARVGKGATHGLGGLPDAATSRAVDLNIADELTVMKGGRLILNGTDGGDEDLRAMVSADGVAVFGEVLLEDNAVLRTSPASGGEDRFSVVVGSGGRLALDGGLPDLLPAAEPEGAGGYDPDWVFKGVDVSAGGAGMRLDQGGAVVAGDAGGVARGSASQRLETGRGSLVDASRGDVLALGFGEVALGGGYRAGYDGGAGRTTLLHAEDGNVEVKRGAVLALSRELARRLNVSGAFDEAVVLSGRRVGFEAGAVPVLATGMGSYRLVHETAALENGLGERVRVAGVDNAVVGDGSAADRRRFHANMGQLWSTGRIGADQAANIYNLTAREEADVFADGAAGRLNREILEAFVDGPGQAAGGGYADAGLFEMYNAGAQWGVVSAAHNVAGRFMAGLDRRVDRLGAEMDRLGEGWTGASTTALASCVDPDLSLNRLWAGGFGYNEEADLDYGISGYTYRPRGAMVGYDRLLGPVSVGGAFAFGDGKYRDKAASMNDSRIESYSLGAYASYHAQNGFNLSGFAAYSHLDNDLSDFRGGMHRTAGHSSYAWTLGARAGYDMYLTDRLMLSPSAGLTKTRAVSRSHDEYLDGVGVLRVGQVRRDSVALPIDVGTGYDLLRTPTSILRLTGNLGYAYDLDGGGVDGSFIYRDLTGSTPMRVSDRKAGRHRFNVGAGLVYSGPRLDLGARYDYYRQSEQKTHQVRGDLGVKF